MLVPVGACKCDVIVMAQPASTARAAISGYWPDSNEEAASENEFVKVRAYPATTTSSTSLPHPGPRRSSRRSKRLVAFGSSASFPAATPRLPVSSILSWTQLRSLSPEGTGRPGCTCSPASLLVRANSKEHFPQPLQLDDNVDAFQRQGSLSYIRSTTYLRQIGDKAPRKPPGQDLRAFVTPSLGADHQNQRQKCRHAAGKGSRVVKLQGACYVTVWLLPT